jgi:hypothetical protein
MPQVNGDCGASSGTPQPVCGVWGDCVTRTGVYGTSSRDVGVRGNSNTLIGVYGRSEQERGVLGYGRTAGVMGIATGQGSDVDPTVYAGVYAQGRDFGAWCSGLTGLFSEANQSGGLAGHFAGNVVAEGDVFVGGNFFVAPNKVKSAAVPHPDGTLRQLCTVESPESWFEDFGRAQLTEGSAEVELDGDFAALVNTDDYHVFLTPEGDSAGLYVSARSRQAFEVREQGDGTGAVEFSYRIVARRADVKSERLPVVEFPALPRREAPEFDPAELEEGSGAPPE